VLDDQIVAQLRKAAEREQESLSLIARTALRLHLENLKVSG
jgi:hypothetical protein